MTPTPPPTPEEHPHRLRARGIEVGYDGHPVISGLDLDVLDGAVTAVIGPNGCGKSTLVRALGRLLPTTAGHVELDGRPITRTSTREVARRLAVLPQSPRAPDGMTVADLVARGRAPYHSWWRQWSATDDDVLARVLRTTGITELGDRRLEDLSGGQRQRAWIAMTLAQDTDVLLLDEPTTFLDLAHAVEVLELVDDLHRGSGRTVVMVLHDLNLAARYAQHLVVMREGAVVAQGPPAQVLSSDLLAEVFGLDAVVVPDPTEDGVVVVPRRRPATGSGR